MAEIPFNANEITVAISGAVTEDIQEAALAILRNVVQGTPVGNPTLWQNPNSAPPGYVGGHARRNWVVSKSSPVNTVRGTQGDGKGEAAATSDAIGQGQSEIEKATVETGRLYIQNNVPYIGRLNDGHSTQARPAMFVERAVAAATRPDTSRTNI